MNYLALIIGTVIIIAFSWYFSVKDKRYHGIARFFAFESIFILVMLNWRVWFRDPFSGFQIISWLLLFASICPGIAGYLALHKKGRPEDNHIERTTILVKSGIFKYIRHPLYCSLILFGTGVMLKDPGTIQIILGAVNLLAIYLTARIEESEMIKKFGPEYKQYMYETRMFIPYFF